MDLQHIAAACLIVLTIIGVAAGRYPLVRMNRATIALVGAVLLIAIGALSLEQAYAALDLDTLVLLFAMMVVNANLRLSGFFGIAVRWTARRARSASQLLGLLMLATGILSMLFLNDTVVIMFTPLVVELAASLKQHPLPYLVGLAAAANIGSVAAITGNPQNMIIGVASQIPFATFSATLLPVALVGLGLAWIVIAVLYRGDLREGIGAESESMMHSGEHSRTTASRREDANHPQPLLRKEGGSILLPVRVYPPLLRKCIVAVVGLTIALLAGVHVPLAALCAAGFLLVTRRLRPERVFQEIDWGLLVFFAGLFVVTGAIETTGFGTALFTAMLPIAQGGVAALSGVSLLLSNLISNVPAVLLFRPFVPRFPDPEQAWLTLAMATTLAGNLTLVGSVANLIVAESAARRGVRLSFAEHLKAGVPITILTLLAGIAWLTLVGG